MRTLKDARELLLSLIEDKLEYKFQQPLNVHAFVPIQQIQKDYVITAVTRASAGSRRLKLQATTGESVELANCYVQLLIEQILDYKRMLLKQKEQERRNELAIKLKPVLGADMISELEEIGVLEIPAQTKESLSLLKRASYEDLLEEESETLRTLIRKVEWVQNVKTTYLWYKSVDYRLLNAEEKAKFYRMAALLSSDKEGNFKLGKFWDTAAKCNVDAPVVYDLWASEVLETSVLLKNSGVNKIYFKSSSTSCCEVLCSFIEQGWKVTGTSILEEPWAKSKSLILEC